LVERPRLLDELRFESEWLLLLLERPLLAPIRPLWLLSVFFVGILNLRQIPHPRAQRTIASKLSGPATNRCQSRVERTVARRHERRMVNPRTLVALALLGTAAPALAGPPYLNDDPIPTDPGKWEIYAFAAGQGRHSDLDADAGFDFNYGAIENVQLTATLPANFSRSADRGWRSGTGDVELGFKYRFLRDERSGVSAAFFPRAILPTSTIAGDERTRFLIPIWLQRDFAGTTSLFGGGGYEINPGPGNRNFWQVGAALTHDFGKRLSAGMEVSHHSPEKNGEKATTDAGIGAIVHLSGPMSLLMSAGPSWSAGRSSYHFYGAFGLNF
jgi:hypothetical protein